MDNESNDQKPVINKTGAHIHGVMVNNNAASVSDNAARALEAAANAAKANAEAIMQIARSLKGSDAHFGQGISLSDIRVDGE